MALFCPTCGTAMVPRGGVSVCRRCSGESAANPIRQSPDRATGGPKTGGGAIFSGRRAAFDRGARAKPSRPKGQAQLSGLQVKGGRTTPTDLAAPRAGTRWQPLASGAPHPELGLFPYESMREGQRGFARDVQRIVERGGLLAAHAPTGIGKTAAALSPAIGAALAANLKVLFLTSKQSQHRIVVETLRSIVEKRGGRFAAVDVISKRDMCPRPEKDEVPSFAFNEFCSRLCRTKTCGYFMADAADAIEETKRGIHHVEELIDISLLHGACPHKVAMGASKTADVIVCDYNYLFSDLRERILEAFQVSLSDLVVIVDEAHNLPERVRSNFSLELSPFVVEQSRAEARREKDVRTERWCSALDVVLGGLIETLGPEEELVLSKGDLIERLQDHVTKGTIDETPQTFDGFLEGLGAVADARTKAGEDLARAGQLGEFLAAWRRGGAAYGRILRKDAAGSWRLSHTLLDPGIIAGPIFAGVHAAVLMSGTLHPPEMYRDLLGLSDERTRTRVYPSPYDPANRPVLCMRGVTSRYQDRSDAMYARLAGAVLDVHRAAGGNTAAFALSYDFVGRLEHLLLKRDPDLELIVESRGMGKSERDRILDTLTGARGRKGALLLGVLGGSLSEGIDYRDNLLKAVCVVGLPLAPPGREVDLLIEHFERRFPGRGRDYAYVYPALGRVLQAAGRGIRGERDRCPVVLLDERYAWNSYARAFPEEFRPRLVDDPAAVLRPFFQATVAR